MNPHELAREQSRIIAELMILETRVGLMGYDSFAADLQEIRQALQQEWTRVEEFNERHPRGPDGAFVPRLSDEDRARAIRFGFDPDDVERAAQHIADAYRVEP